MAKKRPPNKTQYRLSAPTTVSTGRLFIGELFGSIKHWWKVLLAAGLVIVACRANAEDLPPDYRIYRKGFREKRRRCLGYHGMCRALFNYCDSVHYLAGRQGA